MKQRPSENGFTVFRRRLRLSESWKQWFEQQKTRACVPHTPYTSVLKFVPPAGRVCGAATHAVGGDAGYGLLMPPAGKVCGVATHAVGGEQATLAAIHRLKGDVH